MKIAEEIDKDFFLSLVDEEMEDELLDLNFDLIELMEQERYEECCYLRDEIATFLFHSAKLLQKSVGGRTQTYYTKFKKQNKKIYEKMIWDVLEIS